MIKLYLCIESPISPNEHNQNTQIVQQKEKNVVRHRIAQKMMYSRNKHAASP